MDLPNLPNASQGALRCRRPCASFGISQGLLSRMLNNGVNSRLFNKPTIIILALK